jgi:hypothetical protein
MFNTAQCIYRLGQRRWLPDVKGSFKYLLNKLSQTAAKGRLTKFGLDGELKTPHS